MEFSKRKWGWYLTLISREQFKVKLLYFRKGASCSVQRHTKRSELWCFLFGRGYFRDGNFYTYVSGGWAKHVGVGAWHHYIAEKSTLVLEIQSGECREDDIERA